MNLIRGSLENPIARVMVTLAFVGLGVLAFTHLAIDLFPEVSYPVATVVIEYTGASPADIETTVTRPIEKVVSRITNVRFVSSYSREGISVVVIEFTWGTNLDAAAIDIQQNVNQILDRLPAETKQPVIVKFDPSQVSVITLAIAGSLDPWKLRELAEDFVAPRLETLPGVAAANVFGGQVREIQVEVDRARLKGAGLALDQVLHAVRTGNLDAPGGNLKAGTRDYSVRTIGRPLEVQHLQELVIGHRGGVPVRIRDIGRVRDGFEETQTAVTVNAGTGLILGVQKQPGSNTVAVVDAILRELPRIRRDLPPGITLEVVSDQSTFIRRAIRTLQMEAILGSLLAVGIILVFLRNLRSTAIIALSIPISITTTFVLMYFNRMTLNIMTLGGLALGVGRLVDDSIVVLENISRRIEAGEDPRTASERGATEVSRAIIAATVTSVIVFLPIAFVQGVAAVLFWQLALTVGLALLASLFESLTLVPILTAKFLRPQRTAEGPGWLRNLFARSETAFTRLDAAYQGLLAWALARRWKVLGGTAAALALSLAMIPLIGTEFFPPSDEGEFGITVRLPAGTRLEETAKVVTAIEALALEEVPELRSMFARVGSGRGRSAIFSGRAAGPHTGFMRIRLVPLAERHRSADEIMEALRPRLPRVPGGSVTMVTGGLVSRLITFGAEEPIVVEIQGYDLATGSRLAAEVASLLRGIRGVADVQVSREEGLPELLVTVDHQRLAALGLTASQVAATVQTAIGGYEASLYVDPVTGREHNVLVRLQEPDRQEITDLSQITLTSDGRQIPLSNVAQVLRQTSPTQIERKYQQRVVRVVANTAGRDLGSIAAEIEAALARLEKPKDFIVRLAGARVEQAEAFRNLALALLLAVALVYMVLASQYRSLLHPFIIMFSVPLGVIGVIWALLLTGTTLSVISFIGVIMMVGIVVSNAILLVDTMNLRRREGVPLQAAILQAGRARLRPILMTSLTTILGLLPMALALGEGAEANAPLAIAVIGGLAVSTLLTLVFIPVLYALFERRRVRPAS
ncbi:MAG: efflux RND transporter permease subunit [candidate division NC10 bacterium]|nr:efflux RND transporter permease subunit [candidate division NC10 bacterium]